MTKHRRPTTPARPPAGSKTGRVWDAADELTRELGRTATCREVREQYVAEGGNAHTANTQYFRWKAARNRQAPGGKQDPLDLVGDVEPRQLRVSPDGRILISAEMRNAMVLGEGRCLVAQVVAGELRAVTLPISIRRVQVEAIKTKRPGESVVDDFLADRRAMWGEE